jgi:hypothetical protein
MLSTGGIRGRPGFATRRRPVDETVDNERFTCRDRWKTTRM